MTVENPMLNALINGSATFKLKLLTIAADTEVGVTRSSSYPASIFHLIAKITPHSHSCRLYHSLVGVRREINGCL